MVASGALCGLAVKDQVGLAGAAGGRATWSSSERPVKVREVVDAALECLRWENSPRTLMNDTQTSTFEATESLLAAS